MRCSKVDNKDECGSKTFCLERLDDDSTNPQDSSSDVKY